MPSFGYSPGDGTGTGTFFTAYKDVYFTPYVNNTGADIWLTSVDIFGIYVPYGGTFQVKVYSNEYVRGAHIPNIPGPESNIKTSLVATPSVNTFTLTEEFPVAAGEIVWVAFHCVITSGGTANLLQLTGGTKFHGSREMDLGNVWPTAFQAYKYNNVIIPCTIYGNNTTDPSTTNLDVASVLNEEVVEGYSKINVAVVLNEDLAEGYSKLKIPLYCLESLHPLTFPDMVEAELIDPEQYMSVEIFPTLVGLSFNVTKKPTFNTRVTRSINGNEVRNAFMPFPIWEFELTYDYLPDRSLGTTDLKTLMGFFLSRKGRFDSFLFKDPDDYVTTASPVGTGDGVTTAWYFTRSLGGFSEPVGQVDTDESYTVYVDGVAQTEGVDYNFTLPNVMVFISAPADGALITNSLTYYFRCRFQEDDQSYDKFMDKLWELQTCGFTSIVS